jgi:LysM repeat protein
VATTSWTVELDRDLYARAQERAQLEGQDLDSLVERWLTKWVESPSAAYETYIVQPGDSLAQIAGRFYGDAKLYQALAAFNGIIDVTLLRVGQRLRIPPRSRLPAAEIAEPEVEIQPVDLSELDITFIQSPHYGARPPDVRIWAIVIHATANDSLQGVIEWFTNPASLVSAHYNVGKDGRIVQMAREDQRAWHAGKSEWKGVPSVNDFSIGIELVNKNDGVDPYPEVQYQTCLTLCRYLVGKYDIRVDDIMGHRDISLTGKTDPMGFDLDRLRQHVQAGQ